MNTLSDPVRAETAVPQLSGQLCFALYSTSLAMGKLYRKLLKPLGITYSQYLVLMVLWQQDHQTVNDIGRRLILDSATLTPLLKRMEVQELIVRNRAAIDERQVVVSLADGGRALCPQAARLPAAVLDATGCSVEEAHQLKTRILALRATILAHAD